MLYGAGVLALGLLAFYGWKLYNGTHYQEEDGTNTNAASKSLDEFFEEIARLGLKPDDEAFAIMLAFYNVSLLYRDVPKALSDFDSTIRALSSKFNLDMSDTMETLLDEFKESLDVRFADLSNELENEI